MFLNSLSGKLIAVLLAILMPFASLSPAVPNGNHNGKPVTHKVKEGNVYVEVVKDEPVVEDEEETAPVAEPEADENAAVPETRNDDGNNENTPAEEPERNEDTDAPEGTGDVELLAGIIDRAATVEHETEEEDAPIASWDVSNTDDDDVHMYYYAANIASFARTLTASIKELVLPITAYAAEEDPDEGKIIIDGSDIVDGEEGRQYKDGTIVIEGEGATDKLLFTRWLNYEKFVNYYEDWCKSHRVSKNSYYILKTNMNDNGEYTGPTVSAVQAVNDYVEYDYSERYERMLKDYFPCFMYDVIASTDNFWEEYGTFIPRQIEIRGDVSEVNFGAFAFCSSIETVIINANIQEIDAGAFTQTSIRRVIIPETVREIGAAAFNGCDELTEIYIKGALTTAGPNAFANLAANARVYCKSLDAYKTIINYVDNGTQTLNAAQDYTAVYADGNTAINYNVSAFDNI